MPDSVFVAQGDGRFLATELARGPWDPDAQHGGAPAALLAHAFEVLAPGDGLLTARISYEFLRPVPIASLQVRAELTRPGKRVQLLEGSIFTEDETEIVRARALRVSTSSASVGSGIGTPAPPTPERGRANDYPSAGQTMFAVDAMEIRFVDGEFLAPGPATAWFRLRVPVVGSLAPTPLQRVMAAADFGNGISAELPWDEYLFINPDLTVYLERVPIGEWICLEASTRIADDGIGLAESVLYDERGRIGRATQALLVARRG